MKDVSARMRLEDVARHPWILVRRRVEARGSAGGADSLLCKASVAIVQGLTVAWLLQAALDHSGSQMFHMVYVIQPKPMHTAGAR